MILFNVILQEFLLSKIRWKKDGLIIFAYFKLFLKNDPLLLLIPLRKEILRTTENR